MWLTASASSNSYLANAKEWEVRKRAKWNWGSRTSLEVLALSIFHPNASPVLLLIISWSYTKENEQIILRLNYWIFLILPGHLINYWKKSILFAVRIIIYFRNFVVITGTYRIGKLDFLLSLKCLRIKPSLLTSHFLNVWPESEEPKLGGDLQSYLLH